MDLKSVRLEHCYDCDDDGDGPRVVQNEIQVRGITFARADDAGRCDSPTWAAIAAEIARRWATCPTLEAQAKHAVDAETLMVEIQKMVSPYPDGDGAIYNAAVRDILELLEQRRRAQEAGA